MSLPASRPPARTVHLSGGDVEVRGLTVQELRSVRAEDTVHPDVRTIAIATGTGVDEVQAWWDAGPLAGDVGALISAIWTASGLDEGAQFPAGTGNDAGPERAGD